MLTGGERNATLAMTRYGTFPDCSKLRFRWVGNRYIRELAVF